MTKNTTKTEKDILAKTAQLMKLRSKSSKKTKKNANLKNKISLSQLELINQIKQLRDEGVDADTVLAALQETIAEESGKFRHPIRRILKAKGMIPMSSQQEINKIYEGTLDYVPLDPNLREVVKLYTDEQPEIAPSLSKPTLKNRLYRAAYLVMRKPLTFMINFLVAFRLAKKQTK